MTTDSNADIFQLEASFLPPSARVAAFTGREGLSRLYRFEIGVLTREEEIDLDKARGFAATLKIVHGGDEPFVFHGMVAEAGVLHAWQGHALYRIVLVPKVWAMTLTYMSRVFVDMSIPDIIEEMLGASGLSGDDYELRTQGSYEPHFHTGQYRESRWAFISRLMEREGLYYFFEQGEDREKLIITDHFSMHQPFLDAPVRYVPLSGTHDAMSAEALSTFRSNLAAVPREVRVRDFDYLKPKLDVKAEAEAWPNSAATQKYHSEHDFRSEAAGQPPADALAQAWLARELGFTARGRAFGLRPGYTFELDEHPLPSFNRDYLSVDVSHVGNQTGSDGFIRELMGVDYDGDYRVDVHAIEGDRQYRAPRRTPIPRVSGVERAFVDGPAESEYAQIDEHGRYKVKIHFDIDDSDAWEGEASTWLRMLQPHGGVTEGWHFPLRKSTEVMVVFLGGDPDRPVIAGAVPNAIQPSPVLKDNHTQNVIQTGSENRIEIEDQKPKQYIDISTPPKDTRIHLGEPHGDHTHYIVEHTDGNELIDIGGTRDIEVGGDQNEHVVGNVNEYYDSDHNQTVAGSQAIDVGAVRTVDVGGQQAHTVGGPVTEDYGASHTTVVAATRLEQVGAAVTENYGASQTTNVSAGFNNTVGGHVAESFGSQDTQCGGSYVLGASTVYLQSKGAFDIMSGGPTTVFSAGPYTLSAPTSNKFWHGFKTDITGGVDTSIFGGAKIGAMLAGTLSVHVGAKADIFAGIEVKLAAGAKVEKAAVKDLAAAGPVVFKTPNFFVNSGCVKFAVGQFVVI